MIIYVTGNDANYKCNFLNEINSKHFALFALFARITHKCCIETTNILSLVAFFTVQFG